MVTLALDSGQTLDGDWRHNSNTLAGAKRRLVEDIFWGPPFPPMSYAQGDCNSKGHLGGQRFNLGVQESALCFCAEGLGSALSFRVHFPESVWGQPPTDSRWGRL